MLERHTVKPFAGNVLWGAAAAGLSAGLAAALRRYRQHLGIACARWCHAESQTIVALQMRDHLMASASHDLKTPLASIRLLVHVLKRDAEKDSRSSEQLRERLDLIEANVNRMASLINEMLDVARLQGGRSLDLHLSEVDLVELTHGMADTLEIGPKRNRIVIDAREPRLVGRWDADRVERLLTNLVNNGLKYSPADSEVTLLLDRIRLGGKDMAIVEIRDRGVGIAPEDLPHVFEWFYRGRSQPQTSGTGVGLASAKLIVEQHGGAISINSRPGGGTTVIVKLPMEALPARREDVRADSPTPEVAGDAL